MGTDSALNKVSIISYLRKFSIKEFLSIRRWYLKDFTQRYHDVIEIVPIF